MKNSMQRFQYHIQHMIFIVLLITCLSFISWISYEFDTLSDWTYGSRHSLSEETIELLEQLDGEIKLRTYQPDDPALVNAIREILQRYKRIKTDFSFEIINPDIFLAQARQDNIEQYGQTIIEHATQREKLDRLSEESITNALMRIHRGKQPQLMFLSQHGERNLEDTSPQGYSLLAQQLRQKGFITTNLNLLQDNPDTHNSVLVLTSIQQPLLASEQTLIVDYIKNGGNLLWLQDPGMDISQTSIAAQLQLNFMPGVIVDNNQKVSRMLQLPHPAVIPVLEYKVHPVTRKMQYYTLFTTASAIVPVENADWIHSDLLITGESSWSETGDFLPVVEYQQGVDIPGPHSIGIAQQRQITRDDISTAQRVVIIGDTDFLSNANLGQGANLEFIVKAFNWLSEDDSLISISPKNAPDRELLLSPFYASTISLFFLIALPAGLLLTGGLIWHKRRQS